MQVEYLIFNIIVLTGPLVFSHDRKVRFVDYWTKAFISITMVMIPFLIWDIEVSGIHWHFNEKYTLPVRIWGLPLEEILFFISVPFACLFIWQIMVTEKQTTFFNNQIVLYIIALAGCFLSFLAMSTGKLYTSIACFTLVLTIFLDRILKTHLLSQKRTYLYLIIITGLIFVFNGYLTTRPVVLYESNYLTNIRIGTVPIEDFGYGYALILLCTVLFEKLKGHSNG
ncbi:lycopene cyclase domain-containing protein [bacterium]|nr:lycopene cyclase domain-containing protein [bacterium]